MTGVFGKLPAHGDFVRRGLPQSFVGPWDAWLQAGIGMARGTLGSDFDLRWAATPAWRFSCLPVCVDRRRWRACCCPVPTPWGGPSR